MTTSQAVISDTEIASAEKLINVCVRLLSGETFECSVHVSQTLSTLEGMVLKKKEILEPECMTVTFLQGTKKLDYSLPASALEVTVMNAVMTEIEGAEQRRAAAEQSTAFQLVHKGPSRLISKCEQIRVYNSTYSFGCVASIALFSSTQ